MKISTLKYFLVDAAKSLKRNKTISIASAATVAATLFILGLFLLSMVNIKQLVGELESKIEVQVFLTDKITIKEKKDIETKIKKIDGITNIEFKSKKEALKDFRDRLGEENKSLTEGFDKENPIPSSYTIKVKDPKIIDNVMESISGMKGIHKIRDAREFVNKVSLITKTIRWVGGILLVILIGVSLFLIGNTIKLTVYSRRREIGIMKYIGATDWFIRWPFIIEGMVIGFIGSVVSAIILFYAYRFIYLKIIQALIITQLVSPSYVLTNVSLIFVLVGIVIGAIGSIFSIRKFLSV